MIKTCRLVAIEGSHGSGKTTLAHALVAHYKSRGVNAAMVTDVARRSPFVEEVVVHGSGKFTIFAELQIFAAQISEEQLLARQHDLLICDRSLANVLAYTKLLVHGEDGDPEPLLGVMRKFAAAYSTVYDYVFLSHDLYDLNLTNDCYRPTDRQFQRHMQGAIRSECLALGIQLIDIPLGLPAPDKATWVADWIEYHD